MKRRTFFKFGLTTTALALLKSNGIFGKPIPKEQPKSDLIKRSNIVISTWSHGIKANEEAWKILSNGGKSIDAVEAGVKITEADITNRSVGIGGRPDREGHVTLDACIMDENSKCGSVACLEGIKHPISVARAVMDKTPHVMLVGEGARDFAIEQGFEKYKTPIKEVKKDWKEWKKQNKELLRKPKINHENHDTIGMLALDEFGNISGSCTTSGWAYKMHGRVGDSPIIGAGLFIDNEIGGACATGMGEAIIRIAGSHTVVELMRQGKSPQDACRLAVERIISKHDDLTGLQCGFIAMDVYGRVGSYSVYSGFNYALQKEDGMNVMVDSEFNRNW
ncbi:N(4)-(beta-N-acetylglucosaminyl)-L-asparaginase [Crocinitomicaceae bacterium]|nr:N(4)-(beta-N-acetylglucosaminyl)-L-asparaginase [Crocinitomicaceae bacterium]MDC1202950.1 N(4)-(beta-N-acetylglucosaminyl)-L-asparaginase [Crocinitomicaceae bacterium]